MGSDLLDQLLASNQMDRAHWPETTRILAERFASKTDAHWRQVFASSDACVTPVLSLDEAPCYAQHVAAQHFETVAGQVHPAPQPVLSRTPSRICGGAPGTWARTVPRCLLNSATSGEHVVSLQQQGVIRTP